MSSSDADHDAPIRVVTALLDELGCRARAVRVLADRSNLVLDLEGQPWVARVAMATSASRVGMAWIDREIRVARHLAQHGAATTLPSEGLAAGPHEREGLVISFWQRERLLEAPVDAREAGARLAACHRALATSNLPLPRWGGFAEARAVLDRALASPALSEEERGRLRDAWPLGEALIAAAERDSASFQPVHGDAHLGNVLATTRGAVWTDWEDAFLGPVEWDLACLASRSVLFGEEAEASRAALAAYDGPANRELVDALALARNLQVIPWLAVFAERDASVVPRLRARLAKLPAAPS